jgi:predicted dehydrogenase
MPSDQPVSRRDFLKTSATLAAGATLVASATRARAQSANERINIATIGCGGMGNAHLSTLLPLRDQGLVNIVAVCDVYDNRANAAAERTGAQAYRDYRDVLARDDIDAVTIATPDHWHAPLTIAAAEAGKDVYCEKPMTYWEDLEDAKDVVRTIERTGRVMQVGTQGMSDSIYGEAAERIKAGALGTLIHAQATDMRNGPLGVYEPVDRDPNAKPGENLDWKMWLGPAKKRPWDPGRYFAFRVFWDYSGGVATDFFPHLLTPMIHTLGVTFPHRVSASGGLYALKDGREVPDIFTAQIEYPGGPSVMLIGGVACTYGLPMIVRGHDACLSFEGPGAIIHPETAIVGERPDETLERTRGGSLEEHFRDFLSCVRTRQKPRSNEVIGLHCMAALHMAVHSYREGVVYEFDPHRVKARPA